MKKLIALLMVLALAVSFAACGTTEPATTEPDAEIDAMTYEEFMAAETDAEVTVVTYVQAAQGWWNDQITVYAQSPDGAYFLYNMACSEEDAAKLVPGTKIIVTGVKAVWSGEVEIMEATFEFANDGETFIAEAADVTALLGTDALEAEMNKFVAFNGLTVEAANEAGDAFLYNWDGSGEAGSDCDLYFTAGGTTFVIEYYLTGPDSEAYKAVQNLKVVKIDSERNIIAIKGAIPGAKNGIVFLRDSVKA